MGKHALWLGRFQPPTIAHLTTAISILSAWERLTIGIVHSGPRPVHVDPKWEAFLRRTSETSFAGGKNPFTPQEVSRMWTACLRVRHLKSKVRIRTMPQIAYQPDFNKTYDPAKFDFIEMRLSSADTEFDKDRQYVFSHLIGRPISYVTPPFKLHNSQIRKLVRDEGRQWEEFIPRGAYEIFVEINGPRRLTEVW